MNFALKALNPRRLIGDKTDALLVFLTNDFKPDKSVLSILAERLLKAGNLRAEAGHMLDIFRPDGMTCTRLMFLHVGVGDAPAVRKAVASAFDVIKPSKPKSITLSFLNQPTPVVLRLALTELLNVSYVYSATLSKPSKRTLQKAIFVVPDAAALQSDFDRAAACAAGIELAKEWGNRPSNHARPEHLAQTARELAKLPGISCDILGVKEVTKLGMGALLAVAKGSDEPLRFIVLRYNGAPKSWAPVVLVGKGITFDSGGISIKPAAEMDEMKFDMCGAASVLGVFRALAELQPNINLVGLIPACENLPGPRSVKPGDVVTSMSGQTIEILNTDAEGRLVLCDALTYAERFKPRAVIDIATLTGACVVALGSVRSALFCQDETLSAALMQAGEATQDLCWPMPLDEAYAEGLKTSFADVANVAGRAGGAISAAKFLQRFANKFVWAHLDIAGTAWKSGQAKGATGRPVALLVDYLMTLIEAREDQPES